MTDVLTLVRHSLRRRRGLYYGAFTLLFCFQLFVILAARAIERANRFTQYGALMPDFIAQWTNMVAASFRGLVMFGYSHPVVLILLLAVAITTGGEPAAEIESKFIDLLMTRPLRRGAVIERSAILLIFTTTAAVLCMVAGTFVGLKLFAPSAAIVPEPHTIFALAVNLALEVIAWGGITLAFASFSKYRGSVTMTCGLLAFLCFILDYIGRFWDALAGLSRISPFHYFSPFEMIGGRPLLMRDVIVLAGIAIVAFIIAEVVYARRDL